MSLPVGILVVDGDGQYIDDICVGVPLFHPHNRCTDVSHRVEAAVLWNPTSDLLTLKLEAS